MIHTNILLQWKQFNLYGAFNNLRYWGQSRLFNHTYGVIITPCHHWHLLLQPHNDGDLGLFMHRVTNTHTREVHVRTKTIGSGHLYQGRYKSFLVDTDAYFLALLKYIERNPARSRLVSQCENWQWGSAWRRIQGTPEQKKLLDPPTTPLPHQYKRWINTPDKDEEEKLLDIRRSVNKGIPYGRVRWVDTMVTKYNLITTTRAPGRPKR